MAGVALALALMLAGCAAGPGPSGTAAPSAGGVSPSLAVREKPRFTGPFAAELNTAWEESQSDFVRSVIEDQVVSDQEWAELSSRMTACLKDYGMEFTGFDDRGSYEGTGSTLNGEELERALSGCESSTGEVWIHPLRHAMSTNPRNAPPEEVITQCLIRNGAVGPEYTQKQFLRDNPRLSFPFMGTAKEEIFWSCNSNPSFGQQ